MAPWEVDELPEEWIAAASGLMVELPEMRAGQAEVEKVLAELRKQHRERNG